MRSLGGGILERYDALIAVWDGLLQEAKTNREFEDEARRQEQEETAAVVAADPEVVALENQIMAKLAELRPQDQRFWRLVADRKGVQDARLQEVRWLLEELRVSFFAQELRTPQPVSTKRLDKLWAQINS